MDRVVIDAGTSGIAAALAGFPVSRAAACVTGRIDRLDGGRARLRAGG